MNEDCKGRNVSRAPLAAANRTHSLTAGRRWPLLGVVLVALGALPLSAADNPFLGTWTIQMFGSEEQSTIEFRTDTELVQLGASPEGEVEPYEVDLEAGRIVLQASGGVPMELNYSWEGADTFCLYLTDQLVVQLVTAFMNSMPRGVNDVTDTIVRQLQDAVYSIFAQNPFMKGTRVR